LRNVAAVGDTTEAYFSSNISWHLHVPNLSMSENRGQIWNSFPKYLIAIKSTIFGPKMCWLMLVIYPMTYSNYITT
jgi:hypothetical protein